MRLHISHGTNNSVEGRSHQGNIIIVVIVAVVRQFALNKDQWILCASKLQDYSSSTIFHIDVKFLKKYPSSQLYPHFIVAIPAFKSCWFLSGGDLL